MIPPYTASPARLATLRKRASVRAIMQLIESGDWERVLIKLKRTKHRYKEVRNHQGMLNDLLVKFNVVRMTIRLHATVLTANPINVGVPDGFDDQSDSISAIRKASSFDPLLTQVARRANIESEATMRVELDAVHGVIICADKNSTVLAVGPDGPDMQPTVFERRWIIERKNDRGSTKYMRVERHRAPDGVGVIEHEAYKVTSPDIHQDLSKAMMVPLTDVMPGTQLPERRETGLNRPLITRLVCEYYDGQPEFLMADADMDLLDACAAAFSRLDRSMEIHGQPKMRVDESMVNDDGEVDISEDGIVDPDKKAEYLNLNFDFPSMLDLMNKTTSMLLTSIGGSPALLGIRLGGGAVPDSFDKVRLESTNTIARGNSSAVYFTAALNLIFDAASLLDARRPMRGHAVAPVSVQMHPEIPRDQIDRARDGSEMLSGPMPLISHRGAVAMVHGDEAADAIIAEIQADQDRQIQRDQAALMGAIPTGGGA